VRKLLSFALIAVLGVYFAGCDSKTGQCNALNKVINKGSKQLKDSVGGKTDPKAFKDVAKQIKDISDEIGKVSLKDEKLKGYAKEYQELLGKFSTVFLDMADGMEKTDQAKLQAAQKALFEVVAAESPLIDNINDYCGGGGGKGKKSKGGGKGKKKKN
jgi:hypothetical protein